MKRIIRIIALLLIVTLFAETAVGVNALETQTEKLEQEKQLITEYVRHIDQENWTKIPEIFCNERKAELLSFLTNEENVADKRGYFNYNSVEIISLELCSENYESAEFEIADYEGITAFSAWDCVLDIEAYEDTKYLTDGKNYFTFIVGWQKGIPVIVGELRDRMKSEEAVQTEGTITEQELNWGISVLSYDAPVSYTGVGTWKVPSTIDVLVNGKIETVNFKSYCYYVTVNEYGTDSYNQVARQAVAMAVKNYGWNRTLVQKYEKYEYDVTDTTDDQVYNTSKPLTTKVISAVDSTWNYVMLTCDYKLFPAFYSKSSAYHSYAVKNGGVLSQDGAETLADNGDTWQEILHYYYDYGTYNSEMTKGIIKIVSLSHSATGVYTSDINYHWKVCTTCGCIHTKTAHTWTTATGGGYICRVCKCTKAVAALSLIAEDTVLLAE